MFEMIAFTCRGVSLLSASIAHAKRACDAGVKIFSTSGHFRALGLWRGQTTFPQKLSVGAHYTRVPRAGQQLVKSGHYA